MSGKTALKEEPKAPAEEGRVPEAIRAAIGGLQNNLDFPPSLLLIAEKALGKGGWVHLWYPDSAPGSLLIHRKEGEISLHLPRLRNIHSNLLLVRGGGRDLNFKVAAPYSLFARKEQAFFYANTPELIEKASKMLSLFCPFFKALGLADLEKSIRVLSMLKNGESVMEGAYVLARSGDIWALRRGSIFGNTAHDASFLTGKGEVVLSYPQGVEIALRATPLVDLVLLKAIEVRWEGEIVRYEKGVIAEAVDERLPRVLVRKALQEWLASPLGVACSSKMLVLSVKVHISALRPVHQEAVHQGFRGPRVDLGPPSTPSTVPESAKRGVGWA
jgi:hypothetical protein